MIAGVGTDLVPVARVQALLAKGEQRFLDHWFTPRESDLCLARAHPAQGLAARLAVKESVIKALRLSPELPLAYRDVEVVLDRSGAPSIRLQGRLREQAPAGARWHVSLTHTEEMAGAFVVLEQAERVIA